jgi:hypothetical protein
VALAADAAFIALAPQGATLNLVLVAVFGARDLRDVSRHHRPRERQRRRQLHRDSGGLLMVFGIGSIVGPLVAGAAMSTVGPTGLFMTRRGRMSS